MSLKAQPCLTLIFFIKDFHVLYEFYILFGILIFLSSLTFLDPYNLIFCITLMFEPESALIKRLMIRDCLAMTIMFFLRVPWTLLYNLSIFFLKMVWVKFETEWQLFLTN